MSDFNGKEVTEHIEQIRKMYSTYSIQYKDLKLFDVELFNERYLKALKEKTDITAFIKAEISVLEALRARAEILRVEKEKKVQVNEQSFMNKVDAMLEKFTDAINKYPEKFIHNDSDNELNRLYGAFAELYSCFRVTKIFLLELKDYGVETVVKDIDNKFQNFTLAGTGEHPAHIFLDYYENLISQTESARAEQFILKESGFFLHSFVSKFEQMSSFIARIPVSTSISIPSDIKDETPRVYKSLNQKTQPEIFLATKLYASAMINDFRLQHFKNSNED